MKRYALLLCAGLLLGGCALTGAVNNAANTPVTASQIASAKDVSYGLEAAYVASLKLAVVWGQPSNRCGKPLAPVAPLCSTLAGMERVETVRAKYRSALNRLNAIIADTTTTTSQLSAGIDIAKGAYAEYQSALPAIQ